MSILPPEDASILAIIAQNPLVSAGLLHELIAAAKEDTTKRIVAAIAENASTDLKATVRPEDQAAADALRKWALENSRVLVESK